MGHGSTPPRVLIYSHDTYGLGHLRRCLRITATLAARREAPSVLLATGSPRAQGFPLPRDCDVLKLPSVTKTQAGGYRARSLALGLDGMVRLRSRMLLAALEEFSPQLVLVDHAPVGMGGELLPLLDRVRAMPHPPAMVLGLRDVVDEAARVRVEWDRAGVWPVLRGVYDRILVYGDSSILTTAEELGLPALLPGKVRFAGYLGRPVRPATPPSRPPTMVVTAGGGGDGQFLLRSYAAFLESLDGPSPFHSVVVTGPFLSPRRSAEMGARYRASAQPVEVVDFVDRMDDLVDSAAGVVTMAGYNSVVEVLSAGVPSLLFPRRAPRREQTLRAERLAPVCGFGVVSPGDSPVDAITDFVGGVLANGRRRPPPVRLDGLRAAAAELVELATEGPARRRRPRRKDHRRVGTLT